MTREVRTGSRDGAPTKIAIARRTYPTGQADLWDALTNAERIPRWFLPVSGELKVGGRYQLEGNAGGVVERCDEPESFAVTWEFGEMMSWLAVTLAPDGTGTRLELAHEAHVDPGHVGAVRPRRGGRRLGPRPHGPRPAHRERDAGRPGDGRHLPRLAGRRGVHPAVGRRVGRRRRQGR